MITTKRRFHRPSRRTAATAATIALLSGVFVAADSNTTGAATPPAELVSVIPSPDFGDSQAPTISADGGFVAFNFFDVFQESNIPFGRVRDRAAQVTENVPFLTSGGNQQIDAVLSRDGCHVAYVTGVVVSTTSSQSVVAVNRCAGTPPTPVFTIQFPPTAGAPLSRTAISAHGRYVAFDNGINVTRIDRDLDGNGVLDEGPPTVTQSPVPAAHPSLGDETFTNKVAIEETRAGQIQLWDPTRAPQDPLVLTPVSAADGSATVLGGGVSITPSMTPDGRFVTFASNSTNLAGSSPGSDEIYVRDMLTNHTALVTRNAGGTGANGNSVTPSISADGTQIAFGTTSTELLAPNVGGILDDPPVARLDLLVARSTSGLYAGVSYDRVSLKPNGDAVNPQDPSSANRQEQPVISSNGRWVAFASRFNAELQTGGSSSTAPVDTTENVYVIGRPTSVSVSALDFGSLQVLTTSGVLSATVANTGISSFQPASIAASGDFSVVAGGTCAINAWLAPGQSCTVAVQFKPSATGSRTGTLTLAETGFAAITATGALSGSGSAIPVPTTTTTTTTTTPKATTTTQPKAPPKTASLTITPNPAPFGTSIVGVTSAPIEFTVTSTGTRSAPISNVSIDANDTDFTIVTTDCNGANLPPGASCGIVVAFTPTANGPRTGLLSAGSAIASANATLTGTGVTEPTLRLLPNVVELGGITIAVGTGFPPNQPIQTHWVGDTTTFTGTADSSGNVTIAVFVRPQEIPGPRTFTAVDQPPQFTAVTTPGLVVDPSMHPPTSQNPALPNFPSLVVRG